MGKLIYERKEEAVLEPETITFEFNETLDIIQFKVLCKRLASAIGYHNDSIQMVFGNETDDAKEMARQAQMHEILNHNVVDKFFDISGSNVHF